MGGKSYYCDYCDNRMKNNITIRKKHIDGLPHKIAKSQYMCRYRDPKEILQEELQKTPCGRFHSNRECRFGLFCHFSHYTPKQFNALKEIVAQKDREIDKKYSYNPVPWKAPKSLAVNEKRLPPSLRPMDMEKLSKATLEQWG